MWNSNIQYVQYDYYDFEVLIKLEYKSKPCVSGTTSKEVNQTGKEVCLWQNTIQNKTYDIDDSVIDIG